MSKPYQPYAETRLRYESEAAYDEGDSRPIGIQCAIADACCPGMDETCERCHTEYNSSGQKLAPRHQWGEETGESFVHSYEFQHDC